MATFMILTWSKVDLYWLDLGLIAVHDKKYYDNVIITYKIIDFYYIKIEMICIIFRKMPF